MRNRFSPEQGQSSAVRQRYSTCLSGILVRLSTQVLVRLRGRRGKGTYSVGFDDAHLMAIDPKVEWGECANIDDSETIFAARHKR